MPSDIHERLGWLIGRNILAQLDAFAKGNNLAATIAQNTRPSGSASIYLEDGARRDPDMQLKYKGARYPSLIIEIAYTQSGKDLTKLADQYITESSGSIRTVIGISIDYQRTKQATLSIWHPKYGLDEQGEYLAANATVMFQVRKINAFVLKTKDIRNSGRQTILELHSKCFGFHLSVFLYQGFSHLGIASKRFFIPYEKLADYLEEAEEENRLTRTEEGASIVMPMGMRKRKRKLLSPETLSTADERRFERDELEAGRRASKEDVEWKET